MTDGNLLAADNIPVEDNPNISDTITLSDAPNTHHDIEFGTSGSEYFSNPFTSSLL